MPEDINAQYLPSVVGRWLGTGAGRGVWRWVGYALFGLNLLAVARLARRGEAEWAFALLFLGLPLAIETSWPHYFVYLPFAQTLAWLELRTWSQPASVAAPSPSGRGLGRGQRFAAVYFALWLSWGVSVVLASMPFFRLVGRWQDYSQYGVLFVANLSLLLVAHALTLRPAEQSDRPAAVVEPASAGR
jgi:hypothetical protein